MRLIQLAASLGGVSAKNDQLQEPENSRMSNPL